MLLSSPNGQHKIWFLHLKKTIISTVTIFCGWMISPGEVWWSHGRAWHFWLQISWKNEGFKDPSDNIALFAKGHWFGNGSKWLDPQNGSKGMVTSTRTKQMCIPAVRKVAEQYKRLEPQEITGIPIEIPKNKWEKAKHRIWFSGSKMCGI